jgi:alpha-methylacyl-CoA racemase
MGPLDGVKVVELAGFGPGPFCCMLLADYGADVIRVDRAADVDSRWPSLDASLRRGRRSIAADLKQPEAVHAVLRLVEKADIVIEGFRPGVAERMGLGPDDCLQQNPRLVYGRMTGWGQQGPLAHTVGHDINYIAIAGCLDPIGRPDTGPIPPLNLVGDFGGGGMLLAVGVLGAMFESRRSGRGQVVDAAMVDGAALLATIIHGMRADGSWLDTRGANLLDGGAPFYDAYETADGRHVAVGAIEPHFYDDLIHVMGLEPDELPHQMDRAAWPEMKEQFASVFRTRTMGEWCERAEGTNACLSPVLTLSEAPQHHHNVQRDTFVVVAGVEQPAPAPRFSVTPLRLPTPPPRPGQHTRGVLSEFGFSEAELSTMCASGAVRQCEPAQ